MGPLGTRQYRRQRFERTVALGLGRQESYLSLGTRLRLLGHYCRQLGRTRGLLVKAKCRLERRFQTCSPLFRRYVSVRFRHNIQEDTLVDGKCILPVCVDSFCDEADPSVEIDDGSRVSLRWFVCFAPDMSFNDTLLSCRLPRSGSFQALPLRLSRTGVALHPGRRHHRPVLLPAQRPLRGLLGTTRSARYRRASTRYLTILSCARPARPVPTACRKIAESAVGRAAECSRIEAAPAFPLTCAWKMRVMNCGFCRTESGLPLNRRNLCHFDWEPRLLILQRIRPKVRSSFTIGSATVGL